MSRIKDLVIISLGLLLITVAVQSIRTMDKLDKETQKWFEIAIKCNSKNDQILWVKPHDIH